MSYAGTVPNNTGPFSIPVDGVDQLANEANKLAAQNAALGSLNLTSAQPAGSNGGGSSLLTPDLLKGIAAALLGFAGRGNAGQGLGGGAVNTITGPRDMTPRILGTGTPPERQQDYSKPMLLDHISQPQFSGIGYMPVPQGSESSSQMAQLAKALQRKE